jgi:hypothetical protein
VLFTTIIMSLREASQLYNMPFETLKRHLNGSVKPGCQPGPSTLLSEKEDELLARYYYLIQMSEKGFGLNRNTVMRLDYNMLRKPNERKTRNQVDHGLIASVDATRLTIGSPQPLSCFRALCANTDTVNDFWGSLVQFTVDLQAHAGV